MIYVLPLITFLIRGVAINIVQREAFATDLILIVLFMHMGMAANQEASAVEERGHDEQSEIQDSICQDQ